MRSPESRPGHRPGRTFEEELNLRYLSPGAFTILSPEDHGLAPDPPHAPTPYRLSPTPRRNKNQAFSIIAEPARDVRSRSPSPTGRVSPFRGRGFNPTGSRHASPTSSPPPPEDRRIPTSNPNKPTSISPRKSQIPQLQRRSSVIIFTEEGSTSPRYRRKNGTALKPHLSQSLNNIGPKTVAYKPPPSPRRHPGLVSKTQAYSRLSPIIGSSPEPSSDSKYQSSPSRIPKSRSTPPSRKSSPTRNSSPESKINNRKGADTPDFKTSTARLNANTTRNGSRNASRNASRNGSRNPSRDSSPSKPPFSPTRIPIKNYKNVQAKVNSYVAAKSNLKTNVPNKIHEPRSNKMEPKTNVRNKLQRTESVKKHVSKPNGTKNSNNSKTASNNNNNKSVNNINSSSGDSSPEKKKIEDKTNANNKGSKNETSKNGTKTGSTSSISKNTPTSTNTNISKTDDVNGNKQVQTKETKLKKAESIPKLTDLMGPSATTVVSTTTSTVTQPLKIEAKLDTPKAADRMRPRDDDSKGKLKDTPMYMDEGRVLSAKSVSSAIERMNDTVLDSQTLLKDHNLSKLSPSATAIISLSSDNNKPTNVASAVPNVETVTGHIDTISQNINSSVSNNSSSKQTMENNHRNNVNRLISPDESFGAKVNNVEKSANERIKEARTMVASDVKPIRITVQEKPSNVDLQSGNVRFPPSATNGTSERPGFQSPEHEHEETEQPPKSKCTKLMDKFRNKMGCCGPCCKRKTHDVPKVTIEDETKGCFSCLKKNKNNDVEQIIISTVDEVEGVARKTTCWDRLKCCRSNKVGDTTTGCCSRGKRKDSWASRRDSILSEPPTKRQRCKNFFRALFCCGCTCCSKKPPKIENSASRRASMMSKKKSLTPTVLPPEEPKDKLDTSLVDYTSTMKAAIPVLPVCLAYFCLILNIFLPGIGTFFSGLFCLCMGKPRFSQRDGGKQRFGSFLINTIIGCGQLFTVLFCLVGWGWSIWWGVIMIKVAKKHRKLKIIEARMEAAQEKSNAMENAQRDIEKGRS